MEFDVTGGMQLSLDREATNPMAGRLGLTAGGGVVVNGVGDVPSKDEVTSGSKSGRAASGVDAVNGIGYVEATLNLARLSRVGLLRLVGSVGAGAGSMSTWDGSALLTADAAVLTSSVGAEVGAHWGGGSIDSIGIFIGGGVYRANVSSSLGQTAFTTPYVSLRIEGGVVFQAFVAAMELCGH